MKKFLTYLLIILVLGAVFGIAIHQTTDKDNSQVIGSLLDVITPAIAHADSDTTGGIMPPPVPPPPID